MNRRGAVWSCNRRRSPPVATAGLAITRTKPEDGKSFRETSEGEDGTGREAHNAVVFDGVR